MIVIDTSVWISFLMPQEIYHRATHKWLRPHLAVQNDIAAPQLVLSELGGSLSRRTNNSNIGDKAISRMIAISNLKLISMDYYLSVRAARIAANFKLRGADAYFVAVAAELNAPLVSWDKEHRTRVASLIDVYAPSELI